MWFKTTFHIRLEAFLEGVHVYQDSLIIKLKLGAWSDGSAVKNACYSFRSLVFGFQPPHPCQPAPNHLWFWLQGIWSSPLASLCICVHAPIHTSRLNHKHIDKENKSLKVKKKRGLKIWAKEGAKELELAVLPETRFRSQEPRGSSQLSVTPVQKNLVLSHRYTCWPNLTGGT